MEEKMKSPRYHQYEEVAKALKIIAHPVRICIILGLHRNGRVKVTDMICELDLPQSTVSSHLAALRNGDIVGTKREGTEVYYYLKDERWVKLLHDMEVE